MEAPLLRGLAGHAARFSSSGGMTMIALRMLSRPAPRVWSGTAVLKGSAGLGDVVAELRAHFTSPSYKPPLLPAVAVEVHQLAQRSSADLGKLISVVEKDPLLAARVLKLAHSAASAPTGTISSVRDAVVRIGLRNVADVAWEVALDTRVFRSKAYAGTMEVVRKHSIACAHLARLVASFSSIASEYAFLCGLLHDVGMAAVLLVMGGDDKADPLPDGMTADVLRTCHEEASRVVASLWKLPMDIQVVLGNHHAVLVDGVVHPLTAIIALAEQLSRHHGLSVLLGSENCDPTDGSALAHARRFLKLDDKRMDMLRKQADELMTTVRPSL
jgi:HD-like signal output (HDOD) protein